MKIVHLVDEKDNPMVCLRCGFWFGPHSGFVFGPHDGMNYWINSAASFDAGVAGYERCDDRIEAIALFIMKGE